jgi:hypothetical protein
MPFAQESTLALAQRVNAKLTAEGETQFVSPVSELSASETAGSANDLLASIGWMTAGPPSLTAAALRGAGDWAFTRYFWAFEDAARCLAATPEARAIRRRNRAVFSEAIGIGASGWLLSNAIMPSGPLLVADLDDSLDHLVGAGVLNLRASSSGTRPDFLFAAARPGGGWQLFVIECKGNVAGRGVAIRQLATGAAQVASMNSPLPMRRLVMASAVELDDSQRQVKTYAVELSGSDDAAGPELRALPEAVVDASLFRALRLTGRSDLAEQIRGEDRAQARAELDKHLPETYEAAGRPLVSQVLRINWGEATLRIEVGIDSQLLRAMLQSSPDRLERVRMQLNELEPAARRSRELPERQQILMPDGTFLRWSFEGFAT